METRLTGHTLVFVNYFPKMSVNILKTISIHPAMILWSPKFLTLSRNV